MSTFDIKAFEDFCRSKPADETYNPYNARKCALAQFGYPRATSGNLMGVPKAVYYAAIGEVGEPETFGALADRLAKLTVSS